VWIVTYEVNDYKQHGEYALVAWADKPDIDTFVRILTNIDSDFFNNHTEAKALYYNSYWKEGEWAYIFKEYAEGEEIGG